VKRVVSGTLEHLSPPVLLRLVSATSPSGVLEIETADGSLRLEVDRGCVAMPPRTELERVGKVLGSREGRFRFAPGDVCRLEGEVISLTAFAEAAGAAASNFEVDRLLELDFLDASMPPGRANIHVLPSEPPQDPLHDLLSDLEAEAPGDLLFAEIGVAAQDPRWWRGSLEREWLRRGWRIHFFSSPGAIDLEGLDLLVIHLQRSAARSGHETDWLDLIRLGLEMKPSVPVVWVAPLGDPMWVNRIIEAGVSFLMPAPHGEVGEATSGFADGLSRVVERQLQSQQREGRAAWPNGVSELVGALLSESDPDQGISSLLQLAAENFTRGAVLMAENTAVRCRAGFGYPLDRTATTVPRGIGLIERVIRSGEALTEIDPKAVGERRLAAVVGVPELPQACAIIPLGRCGAVVGVLVADREGDVLPDLADLVLLVGRLGGAVAS
jgi:hypothetical protein